MSSRARVGIAIGPELLTAVELRRSWRGALPGRVWSWRLPASSDDTRHVALVAALGELAAMFGPTRLGASIALLRPLAQAKVIATPPLARRALDQLVQRNARRYFITGAEATLASASPVGSAPGRPSTRALAVCAAEQTITELVGAVAATEIVLERVTAGPVALREAIRALMPGTRRGMVGAVVRGAGWAEALVVEDDVLRLALPVPVAVLADAESSATATSRLVADADGCGARPEHMLLLTGDAARDELARQLVVEADPGISPVPVPTAVAELSTDALAAFGAALAGPGTASLTTDALRDEHRRATVRRTASIYAVAAMMLTVGAAAHLWAIERRLARVEASRRILAPALAPVMAERRRIDAARSTIAALTRIERASPRWTGTLAALARALPDSAYLLSLSTSGTKLQLTGLAASAHSVVAPLEASPAFSEVALAAASRRDGPGRRERFELSLSVDASVPTESATRLTRPARRSEQ